MYVMDNVLLLYERVTYQLLLQVKELTLLLLSHGNLFVVTEYLDFASVSWLVGWEFLLSCSLILTSTCTKPQHTLLSPISQEHSAAAFNVSTCSQSSAISQEEPSRKWASTGDEWSSNKPSSWGKEEILRQSFYQRKSSVCRDRVCN